MDTSPHKKFTLDFLDEPLETYKKISCIRMASMGKCARFMSTTACQELLNNKWMGDLGCRERGLKITLMRELTIFIGDDSRLLHNQCNEMYLMQNFLRFDRWNHLCSQSFHVAIFQK